MTRSKTLATWLALGGGTLGLHRLYLRGLGDVVGWLHIVPTSLGLFGVIRMRELGQDDRLAWLLIPLLGLMISQSMLHAIVYGLTSDARWATRMNQAEEDTGWAPVFGVIAALLIGATVLIGSLAFAIQKYFEWQLATPVTPADARALHISQPMPTTVSTVVMRASTVPTARLAPSSALQATVAGRTTWATWR